MYNNSLAICGVGGVAICTSSVPFSIFPLNKKKVMTVQPPQPINCNSNTYDGVDTNPTAATAAIFKPIFEHI